MLSRSFSKSAASTGKRPQNTTGWTSLKPGSASAVGRLASVSVSPTRACATSLICAVMKPISPGPRSGSCSILGRKAPTRSIRCVVPAAMNLICWPFLIVPSITRTRMTTPRYGSYQLSTSIALSGASASPLGAGMRSMIASSISSMPIPDLALASTAFEASMPMISSISCADLLGLGAGQVDLVDHRDDLVIVLDRLIDIGERLRLDALRRVDDEQRAFARGEAAAHFIGEIDMARRVHQVERVALPVEAHGLRLDGDPPLFLDVHVIKDLRRTSRARRAHRCAGSADRPASICRDRYAQ